ncbi:MAG: site-specific DNA-methyltransferase [Pyrinomonadaceae bacterium]|nr:site-specific DNA-methyltransferase [Pyrinomonadaceae bacterium]
MAIKEQLVSSDYAIYNGDCVDVMADMPAESVHLSIYSPPFGGLYQYSSDEADLSNCVDHDEFFEHYGFVIKEMHRVTMPGRMSGVHCADIPSGNSGLDALYDLSGAVIRLHEDNGWKYTARYHVWKEPLAVRNRTMTKALSHRGITLDSTRCSAANADYLLMFRRSGQNQVPVAHPNGLLDYAGERKIPRDAMAYKGWAGSQLENKYSHWIWRQYASAFWDDVRVGRVLPFRSAQADGDERHVHPLQLDVIDRCLTLWSNPSEVVFTPFMGVGSEVYAAVRNGRRGVGVELKQSYYRQAEKNIQEALEDYKAEQGLLEFASAG